MRNSVGLFFNLLLTLLFNKGNVRKEADFYLLYHKVLSHKCACEYIYVYTCDWIYRNVLKKVELKLVTG